ncbi:uncharacterized protein LOC119684432 isoform X1 [Teleopsis dalmanni]|uniref:uncharacterized protein LOC119683409 isoform X1 n=1 Tax=Teleopsis dalmanni TaxID=139649 RepID=UPI0018CF262A|nr:uncharacterized protein LOC119683409 isoform X1 [Teleopsis dalmanni]XP_037953060.1 uncharacterized protein LOC119683456 isoform X1 [Teleopsis dalmanni]XP_037954401.1 uncharacterized protein LOC119684432 isoform X1 [Teleopsis dalmanni]
MDLSTKFCMILIITSLFLKDLQVAAITSIFYLMKCMFMLFQTDRIHYVYTLLFTLATALFLKTIISEPCSKFEHKSVKLFVEMNTIQMRKLNVFLSDIILVSSQIAIISLWRLN